MPPTSRRNIDEPKEKFKAVVYMVLSVVLLVICLSLRGFMARHYKDNFVPRELALFWGAYTCVLFPINLYCFVLLVFHF